MYNSMYQIKEKISSLLSKKNYPCVAALKSFHSEDYRIGTYRNFGSTHSSFELAKDLVNYSEQYKKTKSPYFTYWAVFPELTSLTDKEFEGALWRELSAMASYSEFSQSWDPKFSSDPNDKNFCFSLGGQAFFVVGLHKNSNRLSRQFEYPTLVFNLYEQFRQLESLNQFKPMVEMNRRRDEKFQGDANPMAVVHGNDWEAIQFSGRQNNADWKCPFAKMFSFLKAE